MRHWHAMDKDLVTVMSVQGSEFSKEDHDFRMGVDIDPRSIALPYLRNSNMKISDAATSLSRDNLQLFLLGYPINDHESCYDHKDLALDSIRIDKFSIWVRMHGVPISMMKGLQMLQAELEMWLLSKEIFLFKEGYLCQDKADINADYFYNDDLQTWNDLLPSYHITGPSGAISTIYYDSSRMAAPAAMEDLDSKVREQRVDMEDLYQDDSSSFYGNFHSLPSTFYETDDLLIFESSSQIHIPAFFYAIPKTPHDKDMLSYASHVPNVFVPNPSDYPPYQDLSPTSIFNGILSSSSILDFSLSREMNRAVYFSLEGLVNLSLEQVHLLKLAEDGSRRVRNKMWSMAVLDQVVHWDQVCKKRAKKNGKSNKQPSLAWRMEVDSDFDLDYEASINSGNRASSESDEINRLHHHEYSWNCRGINNASTKQCLSRFIMHYKPVLLFLMETRTNSKTMELWQESTTFSNSFVIDSIGSSGGLTLWLNAVKLDVVQDDANEVLTSSQVQVMTHPFTSTEIWTRLIRWLLGKYQVQMTSPSADDLDLFLLIFWKIWIERNDKDLDYVRRGPSIDLLYGPDIIKRKQGSTERWKMISRKEVHELLSRVHSKRLEECSVEDIDAMIASLVACIKKLSEDFYDITLDVLKVADRVRLRQLRTTQDRFRRSLTLKGQEESVANMGESSIYCGQ
ncbi:OLC1v1026355C1 [Oldenlandia corymbosa var. corymbosa]|uniref:OLC1v1026355C1 n=1 Tax=Oldenlandia corymbosa var. corymbosa TaxID=529605 RepID=A0AAV1C6T6_OLDCO|nr:OLC1v1026355C1 [Oldenlandia corymbosa var. corymbosa]